MLKVCIDPGHGGRDPGAVYSGLHEADVALIVAHELKRMLGASVRGLEAVMTREDGTFIPLPDRSRLANELEMDLFVSIHCNADPDEDAPGMPEARGEEVWFYRGSQQGEQMAKMLEWAFLSELPDEPFRGCKQTTSFSVLRRTRMPAVLAELGFIDNSNTARVFRDLALLRSLGWVIAKSICAYAWNLNK